MSLKLYDSVMIDGRSALIVHVEPTPVYQAKIGEKRKSPPPHFAIAYFAKDQEFWYIPEEA